MEFVTKLLNVVFWTLQINHLNSNILIWYFNAFNLIWFGFRFRPLVFHMVRAFNKVHVLFVLNSKLGLNHLIKIT